MLNNMLGVNVPPVSYRGLGSAYTDLIAGRIDYRCEHVGFASHPGRDRATDRNHAPNRIAALPDVPASTEANIPGLDFSVWNVLLAPKLTPRPSVDRLNVALRTALKDQNVWARLSEWGIELPDESRMTPEGAHAHMQAEIERWLPIVKSLGVTLD